MDKMKQGIRSWLQLEPPTPKQISVTESMDYSGNAIKNRIWYRGDAYELEQLYRYINEGPHRYNFWAATPTPGMEIRKIHTGLPAIIVDTLANIVVGDINDFELKDGKYQQDWDAIKKENGFKHLLEAAIKESLYIGDGAFKISLDSDISKYPIIEFIPGDKVDLTIRRGRITEVIFKTDIEADNGQRYCLHEFYGQNYIKYKLFKGEQEADISLIEQLSGLEDIAFSNEADKYMMAVPVKFFSSGRWKGRGQSIFDRKAWSQWMDALRAGKTREYIPENLLPRNPKTGELLKPNAFDNRFIATGADMSEGAQNKIDLQQPAIPHESYLATYITALDLCLQGLISPSTLGIDVKKLDNAEAQREKEKTTLYTRKAIVEALQEVLPKLVSVTIKAYYESLKQSTGEIEVDVTFGEYANPSFESQIETIGKGKAQGIMSTEACVDELYGDTKDDAWKKEEEVDRLKAEQGITSVEEPAVNLDNPQQYII